MLGSYAFKCLNKLDSVESLLRYVGVLPIGFEPWGLFLESPETFRAYFGWHISLLYLQNEGVSRHETLQLFLFLFPLQHMKRPALHNKQVVLYRTAFRARKVLGTFEKRAPGPCDYLCRCFTNELYNFPYFKCTIFFIKKYYIPSTKTNTSDSNCFIQSFPEPLLNK